MTTLSGLPGADSVELFEPALAVLADRPLLVLTGAGMSTDSGIPDYRGPGSPNRTPMTFQEFVSGVYAQRRYWARSHLGWQRMVRAAPNAGHHALVTLERRGILDTLITQNVDGLHIKAGSSPSRVIEIHGHTREVVCMQCGERAPMERALARVRAGEEDPPCRSCKGILKAATISFGQGLVADDLARAQTAARGADLMLAVGCGSKPGPWMNDSGFWIIAKMAGFTPAETLKTFTVMVSLMGLAGLVFLILEMLDQRRNPCERLRNYLCAREPSGMQCKMYDGVFRESVEDEKPEMRSQIRAQCVTKIERLKEEDGVEVP